MKQISLILLILMSDTISQAQQAENNVPVVANVVAEQVDLDRVLIRYDVEDLDGDLMRVSVKVSADNQKSFKVPVTELEGAVGEGIRSGRGKEIVWTISQDVALHQYGENYVVAVEADDGVEAALGEKITWEKDGSEMMLIPGGSFEMGDHHDGMSNAPVHTVTLDDFYMDATEVTNTQYAVFIEQTGR